ncbi:uncharacterized protein ARMOST_19556 [Armillaria ostoyae]|uniref:Uncharacterized protein n=1 Tax=Armillaria ostoyae TaxID=47428 RepID=A0A284S4V0_ARMOS|nr:uncharacterized protein ARMOST_19556 [Armillaria ostoyae]
MILGKGMTEGRAPVMGTHGRDHVCMDTLSDILSMEQVDQEFEKYQTVRASVAPIWHLSVFWNAAILPLQTGLVLSTPRPRAAWTHRKYMGPVFSFLVQECQGKYVYELKAFELFDLTMTFSSSSG